MSDEKRVYGQGSAVRPGRKSVPWRRDPIILARLPRVERLHLAGHTQAHIAAALDISEATVRDDLKRVQDLWRERAGASIDDHRAKILAELDDTRTRAIAAAEFDERAERAVLFGEETVERDLKGSAQFRGNKSAALNVARSASMDKAKLLGLVVDKVAPTNSKGDDLSIDELMERFAQSQQPSQPAPAPAESEG